MKGWVSFKQQSGTAPMQRGASRQIAAGATSQREPVGQDATNSQLTHTLTHERQGRWGALQKTPKDHVC